MNCGRKEMRKGLWSPEEDEKLFNYIIRYGIGRWSSLPQKADLQRCGKSCRLRWLNYLRPDVKRGSFSQKEEDLIITLHRNLGNRWSQIAGKLPGRTDNEIKNFWNSNLKKKLKNQAGIDPNTHRSVSTETQLEPLQEYMFSSIASSGPITVPVFDLSSPHLDCKNFISEPIQTIENSATALPNSNIVLDVWNSFYTEYYSNDSERNYHENSWIDFLQHDMEDTLMDPHAVSFPPGFDCRIDEDGFDTITSSWTFQK